MRFGSRINVNAVNFVTNDGLALQLVGVCRYIGIYLVASRQFKCYYDNCKSRLYRSLVNAVYELISNTATCKAIIRLLNAKCMPTLLYGLEACHLNVCPSCYIVWKHVIYMYAHLVILRRSLFSKFIYLFYLQFLQTHIYTVSLKDKYNVLCERTYNEASGSRDALAVTLIKFNKKP